jgi:hypothetical protein
MSYSWRAGHGSVRAGGVALDRAMGATTGVPTAALGPTSPGAPVPLHGDSDDGVPEGQRVADELAPMVEVWKRLLAQHVPDRTGCCRMCTKGGTGLHTTPWPCVIHWIADTARRSYHAQRSRAAS